MTKLKKRTCTFITGQRINSINPFWLQLASGLQPKETADDLLQPERIVENPTEAKDIEESLKPEKLSLITF